MSLKKRKAYSPLNETVLLQTDDCTSRCLIVRWVLLVELAQAQSAAEPVLDYFKLGETSKFVTDFSSDQFYQQSCREDTVISYRKTCSNIIGQVQRYE
ncbi:hypothetical protein PUN28_007556 [Cardiocondyla obscurior]|uniref:Uncharacterized protein n=1 Tax=Cardiocondyla obscurior TaxID=286306 RepID=A0AAW2G469_9HYME